MRSWLISIWDSLHGSLWFVPALFTLGAILLALGLPQLEYAYEYEITGERQWLITTAPTARSTLSSMAGALVTVTGVVFSVTMVTLSLTSSQFGSRLLRTFMADRITQVTLGILLATSLYCLLLLKEVREYDSRTVVPEISVSLSVLFAVVSLCALIYFIHHVAMSIQAQAVVREVAIDLNDSINRLFPDRPEQPHEAAAESAVDGKIVRSIAEFGDRLAGLEARTEGYLQAIDFQTLMEAAETNNLVIQLHCRAGHFVARGAKLLDLFPADHFSDALADELHAAFITGIRRTPRQDVECAVIELVEVAVRALSPGINDPFTAVACIDYLGSSLAQLAERESRSPFHLDKRGTLRIIEWPITFPNVLDTAFNQIRQYGRGSASVTIRLLDALEMVAGKVRRDADRDAVLRHATMIRRGAEEAIPEQLDRDDVVERFERVEQALKHSSEIPVANVSAAT